MPAIAHVSARGKDYCPLNERSDSALGCPTASVGRIASSAVASKEYSHPLNSKAAMPHAVEISWILEWRTNTLTELHKNVSFRNFHLVFAGLDRYGVRQRKERSREYTAATDVLTQNKKAVTAKTVHESDAIFTSIRTVQKPKQWQRMPPQNCRIYVTRYQCR